MTKKAALLDDRGVIRVGGEDATGFLQGLLTNDVERLRPGEARYAGLLTPQGPHPFANFATEHFCATWEPLLTFNNGNEPQQP